MEISVLCFSNENGATCCYLTPKKMLICNELMWNFLHLEIISGNCLRFLGVIFRDILAETTTGRCSLKKADPDFDRIQEEW